MSIYPQKNQYDFGLGIEPDVITYIKESHVVQSRISPDRCYLFQRVASGSVVGSSLAPVTVSTYYATSPRYKTVIWAAGNDHPDTRAYVSQGLGALRILIDSVDATRVIVEDDIISDNEFAVIERWDLSPARIEVVFNEGFDASLHVIQYYYTSLNAGVVQQLLKRGDAADQSLFGWSQYRNTYSDTYQGKNQILVRMPLTSRDVIVQEEGKVVVEDNKAWMIWEPYVNDFDILVVPSSESESGREERYEILDKEDSKIQGQLVSQRFNVHLLEATDPRYQLVYSTV